MNKYLPIVVFAICILIAVILAATMLHLWPAALAIALSGAALAMALRPQPNSDLGYLVDDMTIMQEQNTELRGIVEKNNEMIDELADVVEQIATLTADGGDVTRAQIDAFRDELKEMRGNTAQSQQNDELALRLSALETQTTELASVETSSLGLTEAAVVTSATRAMESRADDLEARLGTLETQVSEANRLGEQSIRQPEETAEAAPVAFVPDVSDTTATPTTPVVSPPDNGALRSLIAQGNGASQESETVRKSDVDEPDTPQASDDAVQSPATGDGATLAPVFRPELGAPVAFLLRPTASADPESVHSVLRHAIQITTELEEADREVLLFVWLDPSLLALPAVRDDLLAAVRTVPALQRRLAMLTSQDGFNAASQQTLAAIAEEGCRFGLDDVRDWSLNLAALARDGLAYILVDGPAMATAAQDQGGDPKRLTQALGMHDILLIGGDVATEDDIEVVNRLEPSLVTGEALGASRPLEVLQ